MYRDIVVLTKSRKLGGHCIAGIDIHTGEWVRPVATYNYEHQKTLFADDAMYDNGREVEVLDVVRVPIKAQPLRSIYQPENVAVMYKAPWEKLGEMAFAEVLRRFPQEEPEFIYDDTRHKFPEEERCWRDFGSLLLVPVEDVLISTLEGYKTKVNLSYHGREYRYLSLTDTDLEGIEEQYFPGRSYVVVSLAETAYKGYFFKYVAKVFTADEWKRPPQRVAAPARRMAPPHSPASRRPPRVVRGEKNPVLQRRQILRDFFTEE